MRLRDNLLARVAALAAAFATALPLAAGASPRPKANPFYAVAEFTAPASVAADLPAPNFTTRPKGRPAEIAAAAAPQQIASAPQAAAQAALDQGMGESLRPRRRPDSLVKLAASARPSDAAGVKASSKAPLASELPDLPANTKAPKAPKASAKGSVCGVAAIKGQPIADIKSKVNGCGLEDGVKVTSVSGVRLSIPATIDCTTAKALNRWVESVAQPAYGGKLVELKIAGHYTCRPRNNKKGAKVSEHGRGRAIDIAGFVLSNGKTHRVLGGFDKTMRAVHKGACGIFGTTLGPGSDGYHEDHLHLDTARYRNGAYCR